jgi:hypothetical protein
VRKFSVSIDEFHRHYAVFDVPRIDACMDELIERYGIHGKSVLSVGAGTGNEEIRFTKAGNDVLMIDVDEQRSLTIALENMKPSTGLQYWIGDATELENSLKTYDVLYFSSFTPDEQRRASIARPRGGCGWPLDENPFHPAVMRYATALKNGGMLILQSYFNSIDTNLNPDYVATCKRQLLDSGLHLFESHRFAKTRGVMLYAATKGETWQAPARKLTGFHGRGPAEETERIFAAGWEMPRKGKLGAQRDVELTAPVHWEPPSALRLLAYRLRLWLLGR